MTDQPGETGDLGATVARSIARHAGSYCAGFLVSVGAVSHDQQTQAATLVASVLLYGLAQGWSVIEKYGQARRAGRFHG